MNKLVSKNPVQRFKEGKKIEKFYGGGGLLEKFFGYIKNREANPNKPQAWGYSYQNRQNNTSSQQSTYKTPEIKGSKEAYLNRLKQQGFTAKPTVQNVSQNQTTNVDTPSTKKVITPKQSSMFMGVKAGNAGAFTLTDEQKTLLDQNGIKYGNALELQEGLNKYLSSNGINAAILEDNKWGNQSKRALDFVLNRLNQDGTQRFDNNAPEQVIQAISPVQSLTTFPTTDFKPQIQNVRNNSYNRSDIRSLINQAGFDAYDFSGAQRKALRKYLNGESNDTTLLDGTDLARFTLPYRKQGGLISRNPIQRFKSNFR